MPIREILLLSFLSREIQWESGTSSGVEVKFGINVKKILGFSTVFT